MSQLLFDHCGYRNPFFTEDKSQEDFHELCLYFLVEVSDISFGNFTVNEQGRLNHFEWISFEKLEALYFYPTFLKKEIWNLPQSLQIIEVID